tara:strand:- start:3809 stop:4555 length:747 start_codon:yes stop_codon:yes gene_type:complete
MQKILGIDNNAKTVKGRKKQYSTAIIYLAPSNVSGVTNTCTSASKECRKACLFTSGRGRMNPIQEARIKKTKFLVNDEEAFLRQLWKETANHIKLSNKKNLIPCERLNGTSDLRWEDYKLDGQNIFEAFPNLQFYDYTKHISRVVEYAQGKLPKNYHLTYSRSENTSDEQVAQFLGWGVNVAVVYAGELPATDFGGWEVINGDESDLRFTDPIGKIVGLKYKPSIAEIGNIKKFLRQPEQITGFVEWK